MKGRSPARIGVPLVLLGVSVQAFAQTLCGPYVGSQTYTDAVTLSCDTTLSGGSSFAFGSTVDGASTLSISGTGPVTFNGSVGATARLAGLTANSGTFNANALNIGPGGLSVTTSSGVLTLGASSINGDLTANSNGGAISQSGAWIVNGRSIVNAGTGALVLTNAGNDFAGALTAMGGGVSITATNNLQIASLADHDNGAVTLIASGSLGTPSSGINSGTGNLSLAANGDKLTSGGPLQGGNVSLSGAGGLSLNAVKALGTLDLASTNSPIIQHAGIISVNGATSVNAGVGAITLINAGNDFVGAASLSGGNTQVTDGNALTLGALSTGALTATSAGALNLGRGSIGGNLAAYSNGGAVSQSGALSVAGTSKIDAGMGAITLINAGNDFVGAASLSGGNTQVTDGNALTLDALSTGALTATSAGALNLGRGSIGGNLAAYSNGGAVSQSGALSVAGTSTVDAGMGAITLINAGNDFVGAASLSGGNTQVTDGNALTLDALSTGALTATSAGALNLGRGSIGGNLAAYSNGGAVSQSGALSVAGTSTVDAGMGAITLTNAGNDFAGALTAMGGGVSITATNNLQIASLADHDNGAVTLIASGSLGMSSSGINSGTGNLSLAAYGNKLTSDGPLQGGNVSLSGAGGLSLNAVKALGTLDLASTNSPINQFAGIISVNGATSMNAGLGAITLTNAGNDFAGPVIAAGGGVSLVDANDLTIGSLIDNGGGNVSLVAAGTLNLPATEINSGTGRLNLASNGGPLSLPGPLVGGDVSLYGKGGLALMGNVTAAHSLELRSDSAVQQTAGVLTALGTTRVNAGSIISLVNLNELMGPVDLIGGTTQIANARALWLGEVRIAGTLTADSAGDLNLGAGSVDSGLLAHANGGAIAQTGALVIGGSCRLFADGGPITISAGLTCATLDFTGAVGVNGPLRFGNGSATGNVNGNYTQSNAGTLAMHADDSGNDTLVVTGNASLDGTLSVAFSSAPGNAHSAVVLTSSGTLAGTFASVDVAGLAADQSAIVTYAANSVVLTIKAVQTISFTSSAPVNAVYNGPAYTVTATATSGLPVTFTLDGSSTGCALSGAVVSFTGIGTCVINANQAGNGSYIAAAQVRQSFPVGQASQAISNFAAIPANPTYAPDGTFSVSATGGASGNPVVFASTTPGVCTVGGSIVTMRSAGSCALTADQAGDTNYTAAPQAALGVAIGQATQAITDFVATPANPTYAPDGTFAVSATGGASGNPVIFASTTPGVCTIGGSTVTMRSAGSCVLTADQAGDTNYTAAPQAALGVAIGQATQAITDFVATPANPTYAPDGTFAVSATGGASGNPVIFASTTPGVCTVGGSIVTMRSAGSCALTADQAGDANYTAAPQAALGVAIGQATQAITDFVATPANPTYAPDGTFAVSATGGASGNPVIFASTTPGVCTVAGSTVTILGAGACALTADQAGDGNYSAAPQAALVVTIAQASQTLSFPPQTTDRRGFIAGDTFPIDPLATSDNPNSGGAVTYSSLTDDVCHVTAATVTMVSAGICTLAANQEGDGNYQPAPQVTRDVLLVTAPLAASQQVRVLFNLVQTLVLEGSDINPLGPYALTYAIASQPAHGTIDGFDPAAGTLNYTPISNFVGKDSFTFTVATVNGVSLPATVEVEVVSPRIRLSIHDEGRGFASYGEVIDYFATLTNEGDAANSVPVAFSLSSGFDVAAAQLDCFNLTADASCAQADNDPLGFMATLAPGRSLIWRISVPVRSDTGDETQVVIGMTAIGAQPIEDHNVLVVLRDGFDGAPDSGTTHETASAHASSAAILATDALQEFVVPEMSAGGIETLLAVSDGTRDVRVDGVRIGDRVAVRLFERRPDGSERATAWSATEVGSALVLGSVAAAAEQDGAAGMPPSRAVVLLGAEAPLDLR